MRSILALALVCNFVGGGGCSKGCVGNDTDGVSVEDATLQNDDIEGNFPGECSDGEDNDQDGFLDCDDWDCNDQPGCLIEGDWSGECSDHLDNDQDGFLDCDDFDCWESEECSGVVILDDPYVVSINVTMTAPSDATQANAWIQVQCPDDWTEATCDDQQVVILGLSVVDNNGVYFEEPIDFSGVDLTSTNVSNPGHLFWSTEEYGIGENGWDGDPIFRSPRGGAHGSAFTLAQTTQGPGIAFGVPAGKYVAPFSCDIDEACDNRVVIGGESYYWSVTICRIDNGTTTPLVVRLGMDFLACRGWMCPDGNDDFLAEIHTPWQPLASGECKTLVTQ